MKPRHWPLARSHCELNRLLPVNYWLLATGRSLPPGRCPDPVTFLPWCKKVTKKNQERIKREHWASFAESLVAAANIIATCSRGPSEFVLPARFGSKEPVGERDSILLIVSIFKWTVYSAVKTSKKCPAIGQLPLWIKQTFVCWVSCPFEESLKRFIFSSVKLWRCNAVKKLCGTLRSSEATQDLLCG